MIISPYLYKEKKKLRLFQTSQSILAELLGCQWPGTLRTKLPHPYYTVMQTECQIKEKHMLINAILSKHQIFFLILLLHLLLWGWFWDKNSWRKKKNWEIKIHRFLNLNKYFPIQKIKGLNHLSYAHISVSFNLLSPFLHLPLPLLRCQGYKKSTSIVTFLVWQPENVLITCITKFFLKVHQVELEFCIFKEQRSLPQQQCGFLGCYPNRAVDQPGK